MPYEGIEVIGVSVLVVLEGFGDYRGMASRFMLDAGIGREGPDRQIEIDPESWYPVARLIEALHRIQEKVGRQTMYLVGRHVPKHALMPPGVTQDIHAAMRLIDVAYHMNHRKDGAAMFDPATGKGVEGIGHYQYRRVDGSSVIIMVSTSLYPCDYDRGILAAMAQRVNDSAMVAHDSALPCRKKGGSSCTYQVTWM